MTPRVFLSAFLLLSLFAPAHSAAQGYASPYVGVYVPDVKWEIPGVDHDIIEAKTGAIYGARVGYVTRSRWGLEAGYGFAPVTLEFDEFGTGDVDTGDADQHLYYAALLRHWAVGPAADVFLAAGAGGFRLSPEGDEDEATNDLLIELGGGVRYAVSNSLAVRGDLRDHLVLCSAETGGGGDDPASLCFPEDEILHNIELSGGVELRF